MTTKTPVIELTEVTRAESAGADSLNASFRALDALVQLSVRSAYTFGPPDSPEQGDRYIVPVGDGSPTVIGDFAGHERAVAYYTLDGWQFRTPRAGWLAYVEDEGESYLYNGTEWAAVGMVNSARQIIAGDGLSGGGTLAADRTLALDISELTAAGTLDTTADLVAIHDTSADAPRKVTLEDFGVAIGAGGGGGSVPEHPDIPPTTPDVIDDEFEYGTGLDTSGARRSGSPSPAAWTLAAGASSSEWTVAQGALQVVGTSGGWAFVPIPDTNWKVRAKCHLHRQSTWSFLTNMGAGLSLRDTIADRRMSFMQGYFGQPKFDVAVWNTWTYVSTPASVSSYSANDHYQMRLPVYLELERSGTTIYFRFSRSGFDQTFFTIWSGSIGTYFANNPDEVGLYVQTASQTLAAIYEWFRRIS